MKNKLLKTLLPIASVATITAPITCFASYSCASSHSFTYIKDDKLKLYSPLFDRDNLPRGKYTPESAADLYFNGAEQNKKIIENDLFYHLNYFVWSAWKGGISYLNQKINVIDVINDSSPKRHALSFEIDFNIKTLNPLSALIGPGSFYQNCQFTNFPYYAEYNPMSYGNGWSILPDINSFQKLQADTLWKIHYKAHYKGEDGSVDEWHFELDHSSSFSVLENYLSICEPLGRIDSAYYLIYAREEI